MSFVVNKFLQAQNNTLARRIRRARIKGNDEKEERLAQRVEATEERVMAYIEFQRKVEDWLNLITVFDNDGLYVKRVPKRITIRCQGRKRKVDGIKIKNAASVEFKVMKALVSSGFIVITSPVWGVMKTIEYRKGYKNEKEIVKRTCDGISKADVEKVDTDSWRWSRVDGAPRGVARDAYVFGSNKYLVRYTFQNDESFAIIEGMDVIESINSGVGVAKIKRALAEKEEELKKLEDAKQKLDAEKQKTANVITR